MSERGVHKTTKREPLLQGFGYRYLLSLNTFFNDFFSQFVGEVKL